ncbi:protein FAM166C A [Colossoma macropomum]|uniref:protein FAM166C A n=1 Tax=Colossoma macropomum TaxID=42526 RepID=UPI00186544DC|nr:protein FAM166C A [Colossoma macropomum]
MSGTTLRGNGSLITHNNATYIPASLMPGYCGHVPTAKFQYGVTFGNATIKYFLDSRGAAMTRSASQYSMGGMFPSISSAGGLFTTQRPDRAPYSPYWARYNVDFERQREIKHFDELAQKHRGNYKDKTGTLQPVSYFIIPVKESEKFSQEAM